MHKVLVAGGAGFIGANLCERLLQENCIVYCIDNLITGDRANVDLLKSYKEFSFIEHDITRPFSLADFHIESVDAIYHLASPASPNKNSQYSYMNYPIETLLVNSFGSHVLLTIAKEHHAAFLYASSSEVYGDPTVSPQKEDYTGNVSSVSVRSVYDEGKRFGEAITMAYVRKHNVDARIVRIFNTYGPRMRSDDGRVISNLISQALQGKPLTIFGSGKQTRSFCYVSDLVGGLVLALEKDMTKGSVVNVGNPDERTIGELAILIKNMTKSKSDIVYEALPEDDPKTRKPDIAKAKKLLDWEPSITLEEGLQKTIEYFKNR
ncbi:MAG: GDP-mannose 4,6-dehydratase [Candidatus Levybacteria bacterium]|nr:GDP-mannose 4,6-dehydratase [Candidatus Levybacteria bacterium]